MRVLIQRISKGKVTINGERTEEVGKGYCLLVGIGQDDGEEDIEWLVRKISDMRIFNDDEGKMNLSLKDVDGSLLVVSQFTLHAKTKKGTRPSFIRAAKPDQAIPLYEKLIEGFEELGIEVKTGEFGADMDVEIVNSGPVTIWLDTKNKE